MITMNQTIIILAILLVTGTAHTANYAKQPEQGGDPLLKDVTVEQLQDIISSYKGKKVVLVNIWATWCGPCVEEFPYIVDLQKKYDDRLQVIFVSTDFKRGAALDFLKKQEVDWTTYFSKETGEDFINSISGEWTGAMPFTKILDINGNLVANWESGAEFKKFEKHVKQAINNENGE